MYSSGTTGKPKCMVHSVGGKDFIEKNLNYFFRRKNAKLYLSGFFFKRHFDETFRRASNSRK